MATTGIDGLISGLDTTTLINNLISLEAGQQTLLKGKQSTATSLVAALQSLNTKVASLAAAATAAAKPASWATVSATSSTGSVTAATTDAAQPSSLTFSIGAVAAAQSSLAGIPTDWAGGTPTFTVTRADGTTSTVTAASTALPDILEAFNSGDSGVKASAVNTGTAAAPVYELQLTGGRTGADNAFTVSYQGTGGTTQLALSEISAARDASITLFPGTAGERTVTSATNTFAGVLTGVDVTISKAETDPVTITVARNTAAVKSLASNLVSNLNTVLSEITSRTTTTTTTATDGGTVVTGGLFSGDSTVRMLQQSVLSSASLPVDGTSPSDVGIVIAKDGTFTFDDTVFAAALAADPDKVQAVVSGVASRLAALAETASNSKDGTLTLNITAQQDNVKDLTDRISDWDDRLATRRETLVKTYAALEVSLSKLNSQSTTLASQLAALTSSDD
ncbi:MAG TPA: flagellar filament capping protein FliD [Cellulomonas sp.]